MQEPDHQSLLARIDSSDLWKLLNSNFVLWVLSSVVVGVVAFSYQQWDEARTLRSEKRELIRKLDTEIASRLSFFQYQTLAEVPEQEALLVLESPGRSEFPAGVFPEFSNRSLRALLWELNSMVAREEQAELEQAIQEAANIAKVYTALVRNPSLFWELRPSAEVKAEVEGEPAVEVTWDGRVKPPAQPITINLDINTEIDVERARVAVDAFNLARWGRPFDTERFEVLEAEVTVHRDDQDATTPTE